MTNSKHFFKKEGAAEKGKLGNHKTTIKYQMMVLMYLATLIQMAIIENVFLNQ